MKFLEFKDALHPYTVFSVNQIPRIDDRFHRRRLNEWQEKGYIQKIVRGYYIFSDLELNEKVLFEIANRIYRPSYVSFEMALSYYSLIPESVYTITSASTRKSYKYTTSVGGFIYRKLKSDLFFGYNLVSNGSNRFKIASMEKTVLDYFYLNPNITDFNSLRLNKDAFREQVDEIKLYSYLDRFSQKRLTKTVGRFMEFMKNA